MSFRTLYYVIYICVLFCVHSGGFTLKEEASGQSLISQTAITYSDRGLAKAELDDYEGAIADYNRAIEINPQMNRVHSNLRWAYIWRAIDFLNPF